MTWVKDFPVPGSSGDYVWQTTTTPVLTCNPDSAPAYFCFDVGGSRRATLEHPDEIRPHRRGYEVDLGRETLVVTDFAFRTAFGVKEWLDEESTL